MSSEEVEAVADLDKILNIGALAWSAVRNADEIEILNRYNGVPTLGAAHAGRDCVLFWQATTRRRLTVLAA